MKIVGRDFEAQRDGARAPWRGSGCERLDEARPVAAATMLGLDVDLIDYIDVSTEFVRPVGNDQGIAANTSFELEHEGPPARRLLP